MALRFLRSVLALVVTMLATLPCEAACERLEPRLRLNARNPWLMVVGSDSPTFALYSNGLVIFRKEGDSVPFRSVQLDRSTYQGLVSQLRITPLLGLTARYETTRWTDQPENELYTWEGGVR